MFNILVSKERNFSLGSCVEYGLYLAFAVRNGLRESLEKKKT